MPAAIAVRDHLAALRRPDLAKYVESTRFALTWDDVLYRENVGRPYPAA